MEELRTNSHSLQSVDAHTSTMTDIQEALSKLQSDLPQSVRYTDQSYVPTNLQARHWLEPTNLEDGSRHSSLKRHNMSSESEFPRSCTTSCESGYKSDVSQSRSSHSGGSLLRPMNLEDRSRCSTLQQQMSPESESSGRLSRTTSCDSAAESGYYSIQSSIKSKRMPEWEQSQLVSPDEVATPVLQPAVCQVIATMATTVIVMQCVWYSVGYNSIQGARLSVAHDVHAGFPKQV